MTVRNSTPMRRLLPLPYSERPIKVTRTYYEYRPKNPSRTFTSRPVPWIQMKGRWLEQAGFAIYTHLKIRVMRGCLVVTVMDDE